MKPIQITASSDLLTVLLGYAKKIGVDQEKVFAECGLTLDEIVSKTQRIPISVFNKIWNRVLSHSNDADFGLHFGETANEVLKRHLLYSMMMNCSTIKQAIHKNFQYHNLILDVISPKMVEKGEYVHLYWESMQDFIVEHRHFSESIIVMFMQMLRYLTDNQIKLKSVVFKHQKPENINEHVRLFGIVPEFKNEKNEVTFHRDILDHPLMFSNTQFLQDLEAMAQKAIHTIYLSGSWSDRVVRLIFQKLYNEEDLNLDLIARNMAMTPRNLQMKLKSEKTSYRQLLEFARKEIAKEFLNDPTVSICEIACLLGFADQSAFNHAYKRWTGDTPYQSRIKQQESALSG